jgi:AmmeMemoRadiSam system protein B/AmmeMemoRadiSam system protein A
MRRLAAAVLVAACCLGCRTQSQADRGPAVVREPAVAGRFYPGSAAALRGAVEAYLRDAVPRKGERPVALVAPHAGYIFSGQIAADAWRQAQGEAIDLVVVLGTNHTAPGFRGVAIDPAGGYRTPLGVAETDSGASEALIAADPDCVFDAGVHAREHSVEVQVPFVQLLFPKARILPAIVGSPDPELCDRLGRALGRVLSGRRALVVASSDLSHYPSAADAAAADARVLEAAARLDPEGLRSAIRNEMARGAPGLSTCACGEAPILAAMSAARALGATRGTVVSYANSGDVAVGDPQRVVGYGAVVFAIGPPGADTAVLAPRREAPVAGGFDAADRRALLALARETIRRYLETGTIPLSRGLSARARRPRGAFVTLTRDGALRGCVGRMAADTSLDRVVGAMAVQAAVNDRRFPPVTPEELPRLRVEISVLTPMKPVAGAGDIVVGRDGVLLAKDGRSAVFLPQVATEQGWGREEMLDHLCLKAGLPAGSWKSGAKFSVFQAEVFREGEGM